MKVAIYSREPRKEEVAFLSTLSLLLTQKGHQVSFFHSLKTILPNENTFFDKNQFHTAEKPDFIFSVGGDGTLLESAHIVEDSQIPIVGINTGRIGFLTGVNKNDFEKAITLLETGKFEIENRSLLHIETDSEHHLPCHFALNDITLHSTEGSYLSSIKVWLDGLKINTYWADGLIIATPSGSTAYSLSCGGPIVSPCSQVNVITPIASHSLSVRPVVVPSDATLKISFDGRQKNFIVTIDHFQTELLNAAKLTITKENFNINTVRFEDMDFFKVIREKLLWGVDKRNEEQ
ncbi:MAG: NAD(+)/NADH kinase [Bacteroidales bacterium]|jgi:NAD+ kinase|nr:NAD(+)/NADH kinase [Bacteroidales bacterium]